MNIEDKGSWKGWEYESANGLHMVMTKNHFFVDGNTALCGVTIPTGVGVAAMDGECGRCRKSLDKLERQAEKKPMNIVVVPPCQHIFEEFRCIYCREDSRAMQVSR